MAGPDDCLGPYPCSKCAKPTYAIDQICLDCMPSPKVLCPSHSCQAEMKNILDDYEGIKVYHCPECANVWLIEENQDGHAKTSFPIANMIAVRK